MMKNIKIVTLFIFSVFSLLNCQNKKMEEKFNWSGGICAPAEYQMQCYYGRIIADDFESSYSDIVGTVQGGWGNCSEAMGTSNGKYDVPHTLEFTWYSVVEDKFYAGHWDLDKEKMTKLFKEGYTSTKFDSDLNKVVPVKETYDFIDVGLAPKGRLVVWMRGDANAVEVGCFQGQEIKITKEEAYENFKYVFEPNYRTDILKSQEDHGYTDPLVYARIQEKGYPDFKIYDDYRERFNWRLKLVMATDNKLEVRRLEMCNGEKEVIFHNEDPVLSYKKRAIPYYFDFDWGTGNNEVYHSQVAFTENQNYIRLANKKYNGPFLPWDFYETELYKLFKEKLDREAPIDIVVDVSSNKDAKIYVEQNGEKYNITQVKSYVKQRK